MSLHPAPALPKIVVIGGGFGGLQFVRDFPPELAEITLIDRQNHHLFQPLLYQVAMSALSAVDIAQPIRGILSDRPNLNVIMAEVTEIDLRGRIVRHTRGELRYDHLVIAAGGRTGYFGHPEWERFAPGLKTLADAMTVRRDVLYALERAETEKDPNVRQSLMTLVVIGGGPTGVELAGALAELTRTVLHRDFDQIDPKRARVRLIEGSPRLLSGFTPESSASAQRQLEALGVQVNTGLRVQDIREHEVITAGETIRAHTILWAAGVVAAPLAGKLGVETDRAGRLKVQPDLSLPGFPEAFAVGDIVTLTDANGVGVPGVAQGALQMAAHVARILTEEIRGGGRADCGRPAFAYRDKGSMATIGRSAAVAEIAGRKLSGFTAWLAWSVVHLLFLIGFRNKLSVLMHWVYAYLTYKRGARIITAPPDAAREDAA